MQLPQTIPARLLHFAAAQPDAPAFVHKGSGQWVTTDWKEYKRLTRCCAKSLISIGFKPGQNTCILGFNRPEWVIFDVATMMAGGAPAGIYVTSSAPEVQYIVHHAEAPVVLVEGRAQWEKLAQKLEELPLLRVVVFMGGTEPTEEEAARAGAPGAPRLVGWERFLREGDSAPDSGPDSGLDSELDRRIGALQPDGLATLIYTSGTTGPPKGVMLSHRNLAWTAEAAQQLVGLGPSDRMLSYLPLSHIAEQMFSIHAPLTVGAQVWYAQSMEKLKDDLVDAQPTVFFGVPRVWEKIHATLAGRFREATGLRAALLAQARRVAAEVDRLRAAGKAPGAVLGVQYRLAERVIFSKIKAALGMSRARILVSGAAPIPKEVLEFFSSIDLPICEVYGQSEDSGPTSFNMPGRRRPGSVGTEIPPIEIKIAADEEILVRGPNVFLGYYKDPEATAGTLIDGWLHSGDLGKFDADGFLHIIGRKKEIIITAGGKNIAPKNIEAALKRSPLIAEAVVIGDRRHFLTALLCLEPTELERVAKAEGISGGGGTGPLSAHPRIRELVQRDVEAANAEFARVEQVRKFAILPRLLTEADGELTPTQKLKRKRIAQRWSAEIDAMYDGSDGAGA